MTNIEYEYECEYEFFPSYSHSYSYSSFVIRNLFHYGFKYLIHRLVAVHFEIGTTVLVIADQRLSRFVINLKPFGYYFRRVILALNQRCAAFVTFASGLGGIQFRIEHFPAFWAGPS